MEKLLFAHTFFLPGRNLTVRRGVKWNLASKERVAICATGDSDQTPIFFVHLTTKAMRFADLTDSDLEDEHDPSCRTVMGLLTEMRRVYPGFDSREIVTLIEFNLQEI